MDKSALPSNKRKAANAPPAKARQKVARLQPQSAGMHCSNTSVCMGQSLSFKADILALDQTRCTNSGLSYGSSFACQRGQRQWSFQLAAQRAPFGLRPSQHLELLSARGLELGRWNSIVRLQLFDCSWVKGSMWCSSASICSMQNICCCQLACSNATGFVASLTSPGASAHARNFITSFREPDA